MTDRIIIASVIALAAVFIIFKIDCFRKETNKYGLRADYIKGKTETAYVRGNTDTVKSAARYRHIKKLFSSGTDSTGTCTFSDTIAGKTYGIIYEVKTPHRTDSIEISFDIKNVELETVRVDTIFVTRTDTLKFPDTEGEKRFDNFALGALIILSAGTLIYLLAD